MKTSQYIIIVVHSIRNLLRTQTFTPGIDLSVARHDNEKNAAKYLYQYQPLNFL